MKGAILSNNLIPQEMLAYLPARSGQEAVRLLLDIIDNSRLTQNDLFMLQADIEAAYDTLSKDYLFSLFEHMNFPCTFIKRVKILLHNNVAQLIANDHTIGHINISSSLGQGDPFSVLGFNIGILPLILAISKSTGPIAFPISIKLHNLRHSSLNHSHSCTTPCVNFADDNISFLNSMQHIPLLLRVYKDFEHLSNLKINISKTILAANRQLTIAERKVAIELGFKNSNISTEITFLGHNININRCFEEKVDKSELVNNITHKVTNVCDRMSKFYFSNHARELIISTYVNSVCTYKMLPFTFNKTSLKEPQKIMDSFVIRSSPYTKGNQRYLSSKDGGMGCISLFHHAKASSQFWIKKLINGNSIANRCIHYALATINLEPKDLIYAAKWELKIISYFLKNNLGLIFWAEIVLRLDEFRQAINSAAGQTDHESEMLTHIQNKNISNRIINYFKTNYSIKYLKGIPSILDPTWRPIIYFYTQKIHLINSKHNILSLASIKENIPDITMSQYEHLCASLIDYRPKIANNILSKIKPDFLTESLKFNIRKGLTSKIYNSLISNITQSDFSAPAKWDKLGFGYSKNLIQQAAKVIHKLKLPTKYKSKLYKHNLVGYKNITLLHKLGYTDSTQCSFCKQDQIDYAHIFFDCPVSQFLLSIIEDQLYKTIQLSIKISVHLVNMFYLPNKIDTNKKQFLFNLIGSYKVNMHNYYHKHLPIYNPLDESRIILLYNGILKDCRILNSSFNRFKILKIRPTSYSTGQDSMSLMSFFSHANLTPVITYTSTPIGTNDQLSEELINILDKI